MQTKTILTAFLLFFSISSFAQTKPSKEQTIEFINNKLSQLVYREGDVSRENTSYNYKSSEIKNCNLIVTYTMDRDLGSNGNVKLTFVNEIPIDKIEKISINYGLKFESYQKTKLIKESKKGVNTVFGTSETINNENYLSSTNLNMFQSDAEELLKAFNHLRKLCGAPEPISFD